MPTTVISPNTKMSEHKTGFGTHTTVTAADTIATGFRNVLAVVVSLRSDPVDDPCWVSAVPSAVAGSIVIKTWKNTGGTDPTPAAATTFGKAVDFVCVGW